MDTIPITPQSGNVLKNRDFGWNYTFGYRNGMKNLAK
jgi:hypothetical protein